MTQGSNTSYPVPPGMYPTVVEEDEVSLVDLWRVLASYKWSILVITLMVGGATVAAAWMMPPIYRAEVLLAQAQEDSKGGLGAAMGQLGGLASMVGISVGSADNTEQTLAVLRSRVFLERFIKDELLLPTLFADKYNAVKRTWTVKDKEDIPTLQRAHELFTKSILSATVDKKTGLITVAVEWEDPVLAAAWANKLIRLLNEHLRREAIEQSTHNIRYLQQEITKTSVLDVQKMFYGLIEAELKKMMMANVKKDFALRVIDPAAVPEKKLRPKRMLMVALGLVGGLMLGVFLAFFRNFVKNQRDAQQAVVNI